jgi:cytidyltransferase-like protein
MTAVAAGAVVAAPGRVAALLEASARALRSRRTKRKPVRVYMDGCFDLAHFGHANALRQAKACGDTLVVGLIPDAEVLRCKGPPVLREAERRAVIASVKWVDEIIENVPYDLTPEFCETLYSKHGIDFIVHGDDPCLLPDGTDAYDAPKRAGRFRMIKRTEGVSTTDIVNRVLRAAASDERREKKKPNATTPPTTAPSPPTTTRRRPLGTRLKTASSPRRVASRSSAAADARPSRGRGWCTRTARSTCSTPDTCVCFAKLKKWVTFYWWASTTTKPRGAAAARRTPCSRCRSARSA